MKPSSQKSSGRQIPLPQHQEDGQQAQLDEVIVPRPASTHAGQSEEISLSLVVNQGFLFIVNNEQIPYAQIAFAEDCLPNFSAVTAIDNFSSQQNIVQSPWNGAKAFVERNFSSPNEQQLVKEYLQLNMRDSRILQTLNAIFNETPEKEWHKQVVENPLSINLRSIELIHGQFLQELVSLSLRQFTSQGFENATGDLSVFSQIRPLQSVIAYADCFPFAAEQIPLLITKQGMMQRQLQKNGSSSSKASKEIQLESWQHKNVDQLLSQYIQSYVRQSQQMKESGESSHRSMEGAEISDSHWRLLVLQEIINQFHSPVPDTLVTQGLKEDQENDFFKRQFRQQIKTIQAGIKARGQQERDNLSNDRIMSDCDSEEILEFEDLEQNNQNSSSKQLSQGNEKIDFKSNRAESWRSLESKILQGIPLSKHEEDQWRYFAFEDNILNALVTLGEKSLISDEDIQSGLKCYQILYCLGHKASLTILYSLLCYCGKFSQALCLVENTNLNVQKAHALAKMQENKKSIDLISKSFKGSSQMGSKIQFSYILTSLLKKHSKHLGALTAYLILNKNVSTDLEIGIIFKLFLIGKLVQKGIYFEQSSAAATKIFQYILNNLEPNYFYEFITVLFVKKALENLSKSKKLTQTVKQTKSSQSSSSVKSTFAASKTQSKMSSTTRSSGSSGVSGEKGKHNENADQLPQPWDQFAQTTLGISVKDIRTFLDKENLKLDSMIHNVNTDHDARRDAHLIYSLSMSILFKPEKDYQRSFFDENKSKMIRQNHINCKIVHDFLTPTRMWPLNLVNKSEVLTYDRGAPQLTEHSNPNQSVQLVHDSVAENSQTQLLNQHSPHNHSEDYPLEGQALKKQPNNEQRNGQQQLQKENQQLVQEQKQNQDNTQQNVPLSNNLELKTDNSQYLSEENQNGTKQDDLHLDNDNQFQGQQGLSNNFTFQQQKPTQQQADPSGQTVQNPPKSEKQSELPLIKQQQREDGRGWKFEGRLTSEFPCRINEDEIVMDSDPKAQKRQEGHFVFNGQVFSRLQVRSRYLLASSGEQFLNNLVFSSSPSFLNTYAVSVGLSCIYAEPYLCNLSELIKNDFDQELCSNNHEGKLVSEISGLFQIVSLCVSLHNSELYGMLAFHGINGLLVDYEGFIKMPHILQLLEGSISLDWNTIPPEMLLEDYPMEECSKADVWALGSLLYSLFYGKNIISQESTCSIDQYQQEINKFKSLEHIDGLFAQANLPSQPKKPASASLAKKSQTNTASMQEDKEKSRYFNPEQFTPQFKALLESLIRQSLVFEPCARPKALELLLEVHEFIKKSNAEGIFGLYNPEKVNERIKSLDRLRFIPPPTPQQEQLSNQQGNKVQQQQQQKQDTATVQSPSVTDQQLLPNQTQNAEGVSSKNLDKTIENNGQTPPVQQSQTNPQGLQDESQQQKQGETKLNPGNLENQQGTLEPQKQSIQPYSQNMLQSPQNTLPDNRKIRGEADHQFEERKSKFAEEADKPKNYLVTEMEEAIEQEKQFWKKTKCYFIGGGSVLLQQEKNSFYFTPFKTEHHLIRRGFLQNARKEQKTNSLGTQLMGEGIMILQEEREIEGYFGEYGLPISSYIRNQFTGKSSMIGFEEKSRMPKTDSEKSFIEDIRDKHLFFREHQQLIKTIATINSQYKNCKKFLDFFGHWVCCEFHGVNAAPTVGPKTGPLMLIGEHKTLLYNKNTSKAFLFDYSAMTYSVFEEQPEESNRTLLSVLKTLSNSGHVEQHLLWGCRYTGSLSNWEPIEGNLMFYDTEIQVNGSVQRNFVYQTTMHLPNGEVYRGGVLNGRFWDYGKLYKGNTLVLEGNFVDNTMVNGVLYYNDERMKQPDVQLLKYIGDVMQIMENGSYQKHGKGQLFYRSGDIYEGDFIEDFFQGYGKILYKGGVDGYFEGEFYKGLKHGEGRLIDLVRGIEFEGNYYNNKRHDYGIEKLIGVHEYMGYFRDGKKNGHGKILYATGSVREYEGAFEDDKKHGEGIEINQAGNQCLVKYWKDSLISSAVLKKNKLPEVLIPESKSEDKEFYTFA